jgi:hypothetical protein
MFNFGNKNDLTKDLAKLLKEEGDFVQELSDVSAKAAEFHARLESIEKALGTDPAAYNSKEADKMVEKAIGALKFANAKIIGFILNDAKTGTVYSGYKSDGYRYGKKKNHYERYGYHNNETKEFDELNKNK